MTFQPSQSSVDYLGREIKLTPGVVVSTVFGALVSDRHLLLLSYDMICERGRYLLTGVSRSKSTLSFHLPIETRLDGVYRY